MAQEIKHFVSSKFGNKDLRSNIPAVGDSEPDAKYTNKDERQAMLCEEPIDLRDMFPTLCYPYREDGITHYFDGDTENFYLKQLESHKGKYTQAVYEAVLKHSAARLASGLYGELDDYDIDYEAITFNPPTVIPVGYSQHRQEGRLNFTTDVEIELSSGKVIQGRSVDISPSGVQIKLSQLLDVIDGMYISICFPTLEVKYKRHFGHIPYRLMKSSIGSMHMSLMLSRVDPGYHPFDVFLQEFIDNKKHRYRLDAEDSKLALTAKAWEYLYTKALPYLACFVSTNDERMQIQEIAISQHNKQQLSGLGNSMLSCLEQQMSSFRLKRISDKESYAPEIYAYRYQDTGLRRRLCATSWQFTDNNSKLAFLRTGLKEDTLTAWRINVVQLKDMSEQRSSELLDKLAESKPEQAESLLAQLNNYEYIIYLVDVTESLRYDPLLAYDESLDVPDDNFFDAYEIQRGHAADYTRLRLGISKQRNEERFIYQSPVVIKFYGESIKGHTLDLSVNGLKVMLDSSKSFQIRDTVSIDFVGFNKKFRSSKLKRQSYRIAAITKDGSLCLTRDHRIARHEAAIFLVKLLKKNKDILPSCTGELWMSTKSRLMESWLNLHLPTQALLMTREEGRYNIPYLLSSNYTQQLLAPFQIGREIYNFKALVELPILKEKLSELRIHSGKPMTIEIYISQEQPNEDDIPDIELKCWSDFKDDIDRIEYLTKCSRKPIFTFCHLSLGKVPRLDKSDFFDDMNVIRINARHRLTEFENEYQSLAVILELIDCTDLIMQRYDLSQV
ncbi:MAG: PilZ domain-containing protein [Gammaproteobacteria bacterium]|nr:PilZ domain-containing protein [Gammaproteobacteria bacterium]